MKTLFFFILCFSIFTYAINGQANTKNNVNSLAIPYTKYVLNNGLTLIVHQDKKAPIVSVNVWYHVGSKDEKFGRTGFAHLFEHLMFNGSENYNDDWFKAFDKVGATGLNGTTNQDRTNYFQTVPKNALEMTLWMESDRMGHLLGAIDQAKLDEQREVVKNEKRQSENQPYGKVYSTILKNVYPNGHPYSWSVIGSMEDLNAASVDDVHQWFVQEYGAANATIVLAGDIEPVKAKALVTTYFAHIPAGKPTSHQKSWIAKRNGKHEQIMYDDVPQAAVIKVWNVPQWGSRDADYLKIASAVLSSDKKSRLYQRLVYDEQVASDVSAFSFNSEIGGLFGIEATANDPKKLDYIEKIIDEELRIFLQKGPTKAELSRIKNGIKANFIRGMERISGKSDLLAQNQVFANDPNFYLRSLQRIESATPNQITQVSKQWLDDGEYVLRVLPFAKHKTAKSSIDRSTGIPKIGQAPDVSFDTVQKFSLSNGLPVILAERHSVPTVTVNLMVNAGFATDQNNKIGVANLAMQMLDEGTKNKDALEISSEFAELGSQFSSTASLTNAKVRVNALKDNLPKSLALFSDIILHPAFSQKELARLKVQQLAAIQQEQSSPFGLATRIFPTLLYDKQHAYSKPFSGSGDAKSVQSISTKELLNFHQTYFTAQNANLIVVGDITKAQLQPLLEKALGNLPTGKAHTINTPELSTKNKAIIYLVDKPHAQQSVILAGKLIPKYGFAQELPLSLSNAVFGGGFTSRINLNLREDKGWSYGARSSIVNTNAQRPLIISAPVQTDKTAQSIMQIQKELTNISTSAPTSKAELELALNKKTLTLPGRWETNNAIESDIITMLNLQLPDNYWAKYAQDLRTVSLEAVKQSAVDFLHPQNITWLIVGDIKKIAAPIRKLQLGEVIILDNNGNIVPEDSPL